VRSRVSLPRFVPRRWHLVRVMHNTVGDDHGTRGLRGRCGSPVSSTPPPCPKATSGTARSCRRASATLAFEAVVANSSGSDIDAVDVESFRATALTTPQSAVSGGDAGDLAASPKGASTVASNRENVLPTADVARS